jgi:hypothetical protein
MAYNFKKKTSEEAGVSLTNEKDKDLHGKCTVWGCTRWGNVYAGKWHCRYHWACHGDDLVGQLAHVSKILANHEPEINWLETLQASNEVDWLCLGLKDKVPHGMECLQGEDFKTYRKRIEIHIAGLLAYKKMRPIQPSHKMASAGDGFNNIELPEF